MRAFHCPQCGIATGEGDYCFNCGEPLTIECAVCGATWRYYKGYKYCPVCGAKAGRRGVSPRTRLNSPAAGRPEPDWGSQPLA